MLNLLDSVRSQNQDLDSALVAYRDRLGIPAGVPVAVENGVRHAVCTPPSGGEIHLVTPSGSGGAFGAEISRFLAERGEGMFALVFQSDDLAATRQALEAKGVTLRRPPGDSAAWEIDAVAVHGARMRIEDRPSALTA